MHLEDLPHVKCLKFLLLEPEELPVKNKLVNTTLQAQEVKRTQPAPRLWYPNLSIKSIANNPHNIKDLVDAQYCKEMPETMTNEIGFQTHLNFLAKKF